MGTTLSSTNCAHINCGRKKAQLTLVAKPILRLVHFWVCHADWVSPHSMEIHTQFCADTWFSLLTRRALTNNVELDPVNN